MMFLLFPPRQDTLADVPHGNEDVFLRLLRRQQAQTRRRRQFDVDAQAVDVAAQFTDELGTRPGDALHVDVAVEFLFVPQDAGRPDEELRRIVRRTIDAGTEEQAFDVIAPVKGNGHVGNLFRRQDGPFRFPAGRVDTVGTVVDTAVGHEDLEERHTAAVSRPGMADAADSPIADAPGLVGPPAAAGRTGHVVLGRVAENMQFLLNPVPIHDKAPPLSLYHSIRPALLQTYV